MKTLFLITLIITFILVIKNAYAEDCYWLDKPKDCPTGYNRVYDNCIKIECCKPSDGGGGGGGGGNCDQTCSHSVFSASECCSNNKDRNRDCWNSQTNSWDFSGCSQGTGACIDCSGNLQIGTCSIHLYPENGASGGVCEEKCGASPECDEWNPWKINPYQKAPTTMSIDSTYCTLSADGSKYLCSGYCDRNCIFHSCDLRPDYCDSVGGSGCLRGPYCPGGNCSPPTTYQWNPGRTVTVEAYAYGGPGYQWTITDGPTYSLNWPGGGQFSNIYAEFSCGGDGGVSRGHHLWGTVIVYVNRGETEYTYCYSSDTCTGENIGPGPPGCDLYLGHNAILNRNVDSDFFSKYGFHLDSSTTITKIQLKQWYYNVASKDNSAYTTYSYPNFVEDFPGSCIIVCNNNTVCESGETQDNCPNDCKTIVGMQPNVSLVPGQPVAITVEFYDGRYLANHDVKIDLTIDGQTWSSEDCWINGKKWSEMGWSGMSGGGWSCSAGRCEGAYQGHSVAITSTNGYGKIEAECKIPVTATAFTHVLQAIPTIY